MYFTTKTQRHKEFSLARGARSADDSLESGGPMKKIIVAFLFLLASVASAKPSADLIVSNAKIWTVDPSMPQAQAVAVIGDRIVDVGTDAEIAEWRGPQTKVIDAKGRRVLPGFNDAHVHFLDGGRGLENIDLKNTTSQKEFAKLIAERAQRTPENEWILGGNWDDQQWTPAVLPTKDLIDPVTPKNPVLLDRYDGHMVLANSIVLKLAGVTAKTPDPPGGVIGRDAQGNPTGIFRDAAMSLVYDVVPPLSKEQRLHAIRIALDHAASVGVTSVQHMSADYASIEIYEELAEKGELTSRIYAAPMETGWEDQAKIGIRRAFGSSFLRVGALKGFADGSLGSSTAYFFEPFLDDPKNHGLLSDEMQPLDKMLERMIGADRAGLQLCIHAIGDQGISIVLDLFEKVIAANGERDRRFRIEHAQHMAWKDFDRFAKMHVIASVQPYHAIDDGGWAEKRIGPERIKSTYAFRTFLDKGVALAFGTDWSVAPLNPMDTLYAAVTRATLNGQNPHGWVPEQKITLEEAVKAYTMGSAFAEFQENQKGSITRGKLADMVILSDDIFSMAPERIRDVRVLTTIVGGKIVFNGSNTESRSHGEGDRQ